MGHAYLISDFKDPTCTESGFKTYSCTRCGDVYTENIHALGHDESSQYQYVTKIGKMIIGGKTIYRCKRCGAVREVADGKYIHR
jgi:DNA-directed RNA polymerase subunit RPC12/RpoP